MWSIPAYVVAVFLGGFFRFRSLSASCLGPRTLVPGMGQASNKERRQRDLSWKKWIKSPPGKMLLIRRTFFFSFNVERGASKWLSEERGLSTFFFSIWIGLAATCNVFLHYHRLLGLNAFLYISFTRYVLMVPVNSFIWRFFAGQYSM